MSHDAMMRHVIFEGSGGPEVIELRESAIPRPGPGQVLLAVAYAGVNRPDCLQRAGLYPPPPGAGDIPGLEAAGLVAAVGPDVAWPRVGEAVTALLAGGGYADYAVAEAALCLPVPEGLSQLEAAALPETAFTVYDNVITRGRLAAGESLLIHGGSSGIGAFAIELARAWGASVFATAGTPEKCSFCQELGVDLAINHRSEDFVARLREATKGAGVDVILDMVGGDYLVRNLECLAFEGRLIQIAFLRGSQVNLDLRTLMTRRLTVTGSTLRPRSVAQKAAIARELRARVWPLVAAGHIRPRIDHVFPLAEAGLAHARMEANVHMGKIMLKAAHEGA